MTTVHRYFTLKFLPDNLVHFIVRGRIAVRLPLHKAARVSRIGENSNQRARDDHWGSISFTYFVQSFHNL